MRDGLKEKEIRHKLGDGCSKLRPGETQGPGPDYVWGSGSYESLRRGLV